MTGPTGFRFAFLPIPVRTHRGPVRPLSVRTARSSVHAVEPSRDVLQVDKAVSV